VGWNKGGVAVSLQLGYTDVCIVNSHLAAHQGKLKERNHNYSEIAGRWTGQGGRLLPGSAAPGERLGGWLQAGGGRSLLQAAVLGQGCRVQPLVVTPAVIKITPGRQRGPLLLSMQSTCTAIWARMRCWVIIM
jgi:hypothetical protein